MGPKKRPASSSPVQGREITREASEDSDDERESTDVPTKPDITAQNAVNSPLLRLPLEIRDKIWAFAYGNMTVHVDMPNPELATHPGHRHSLTYTIYPEVGHYQAYELLFENLLQANNHASSCAHRADFRTQLVCCHHMQSQLDAHVSSPTNTPALSLSLVCKQFWNEASYTLLTSSTFAFTAPVAFRHLALSSQTAKLHIRRVAILVYQEWPKTPQSSIVGQFENLERVNLVLYLLRYPIGVLRHTWVICSKYHSVIRAFHQNASKDGLTTVAVLPDENQNEEFSLADLRRANAAIRARLMHHHLIRRSQRENRELVVWWKAMIK
ncbi:hypothetical protein EJ02DRAFT_112786 [Clathrospora elynae]|uniref:DUF7730 domain-containing protein n=1 Tax=Clathrospora elynae TaxID=706981 RepID=A0A6A5S6Q5_9PLEO|nr:hypothetical protein EJ02DRAFT_112786 [Clathrospora elynae]